MTVWLGFFFCKEVWRRRLQLVARFLSFIQ